MAPTLTSQLMVLYKGFKLQSVVVAHTCSNDSSLEKGNHLNLKQKDTTGGKPPNDTCWLLLNRQALYISVHLFLVCPINGHILFGLFFFHYLHVYIV